MKLTFDVIDNVLKRTDKIQIINQNKNIYQAVFNFISSEEDIWLDENIFVIFEDSWGNKDTLHLGKNSPQLSIIIPTRVLEGTYFKVSVFAGELITTNTVTLPLTVNKYSKHHSCRDEDYKDIFVEIYDKIDSVDESLDEKIRENKINVDSELSLTSENPVQNKLITSALDDKADKNHDHVNSDITDLDDAMDNDMNKLLQLLAEEIAKE